jgi:hypothetical protein
VRKALAFLIAATLLGMGGCGKGSPTLPTPLPSPSAPPADSFPGPLHVEGEKWISPKGEVKLLGVIVCCMDYPQNGWPWVSDSFIQTISESGGNFTHFRLGPFTAQGEKPEFVAYKDAGNGRVDLSEWNDMFWQALANRLSVARSKGVYVELDLIDSWVLERPEIHPWYKENNINGVNEGSCDTITRPITPLQERWLTKIIDVTKGFDNVIYQVSNESFDCGRKLQDEWEISIIDFVHRLHPRALVGTNSGRDSIAASADYVEDHGYFAQPPRGKPFMVNEYGADLTPEEIKREMEQARAIGSSFHYWRGGHDDVSFSKTLEYLRSIVSSS